MKVGRNDPCPCGSGRKYKQCCLSKETDQRFSPQQVTWRRIRQLNEGLAAKILRFMSTGYGDIAIEEGWDEFTIWEGVDDDERRELLAGVFFPWLLHHWSPDPADTDVEDEQLHDCCPTEAYLQAKGHVLDPIMRSYLASCCSTPFAFYEILESRAGHGFKVCEVLTERCMEVLEASASQSLGPGDIIYALLVPCEDIMVAESISPIAFAPLKKLPVMEFGKKLRGTGRQVELADLHDYDLELRELYFSLLEDTLHLVRPELRNTDDELIALQTLHYEIDSPQQTFDALRHLAAHIDAVELLAGATRSSQGQLHALTLPWSRVGNAKHAGWENTTLGTLQIDGSHLRAQVNSNERAATLRALISESLGGQARYLRTELHSLEEPASPSTEAESNDELLQSPELREQLTALMRQHYQSWLDEQMPLLDGVTPREAARDRDGRKKVAVLLADLERNGRRMTPPLDESITRELREQLGL